MMMVPFVVAVTLLSITGYTMLLGQTVRERFSGFGVLVAAALVTGAYVSANFNGGKPYGFDIAIGVEPWRHGKELPVQPVSATPKRDEQKPEENGAPIV
jgi:hypothetical protein